MRKYRFALFVLLSMLVLGLLALVVVFSEDPRIAVLSPKGLIALKQRGLLVDATWLMFIVVIPALFLTFFYAWKYRESNTKAVHAPDWDQNIAIELIWWGVPCIIVIVLSVYTWRSCHELDPFKAIESKEKPVRIQVVALDWKWLFIYPEEKIATINWTQFPVNRPLNFEITADAPMNSFWIPELGGQIYAMSGMRSQLHLIADEMGKFRGSSANLSGKGFSGMWFTAAASSEAEFESWAEGIRTTGAPLNYESYLLLVEPTEYDPPAFYSLQDENLFEKILMKYMPMEMP